MALLPRAVLHKWKNHWRTITLIVASVLLLSWLPITIDAGTANAVQPPFGVGNAYAAQPPSDPHITRVEPARIADASNNRGYTAISFVTPQDGWVATGGDVLLHTTNGSRSWASLPTHKLAIFKLQFLTRTVGFAVAGVDHIGTGGRGMDYRDWVVARTLDGGAHWTIVYQIRIPTSLTSIGSQLDCVSSTSIYALLGNTVVATSNAGKSWRTVHFTQPDLMVRSLSFVSNKVGWVGGVVAPSNPHSYMNFHTLILHTTDGGRMWTIQVSHMKQPQLGLLVTFLNPSDGWLITSSTITMTDQLYKTVDGGKRWTLLQSSLLAHADPLGVGQPVFLTPNYGWIPDAMGAMPMASGLDIATDGGRHLQLVGARRAWSISAISLLNKRDGYVTGYNINHSFVLKTVNGGKSFTQILPQLSPTQGVHFVSAHLGYGIGDASDYNAFLTSADGGESWRLTARIPGRNPDGATLTFANAKDGWIVAHAGQWHGAISLYRTVDAGKRWTLASRIPGSLFSSSEIQALHFWNGRDGLLEIDANNEEQIWRTQDGGTHWTHSTTLIMGLGWLDSWASPAVIFGINSEQLYQNMGHRPHMEITVQRSTNSGQSWRTLWRQPKTFQQIGTVDFVSPMDGWITVYVWPPGQGDLYLFRILQTGNGGRTWNAYTFADNAQLWSSGNGVALDFINKNTGWMLAQYGLLRTTDGGRTWTWLSSPLSP
ncbi:MAG: WD40/YVTN/BNR-like repeat-containing protein [Bacilli bacterium]